METIQLGVDDFILKMFGEERIKEYLNKMIAFKRMEFFTGKVSGAIDLSENEYEEELDNIRAESWKDYKKDLPL